MRVLDKVVDILNRTKAEVPALAVAGGLLLGTAAAYLSNWNELTYGTQFSEQTQIKRDAEKSGKKPSAVTLYHARALDTPMKIFESHNTGALYPSNKDYHFAKTLKRRFNEITYHNNLDGMTDNFEQDIAAIRSELSKFRDIGSRFSTAHSKLKGSWKHTPNDVYLPFPETHTVTDSEGNTSTETTIELKHVWTDHSFDFARNRAEQALPLLQNLDISGQPVTIQKPSRLNEQNLNAIISSRKQINPKSDINPIKAENIGLSWGNHSRVVGFINAARDYIVRANQYLPGLRNVISTAPKHAESRTYTPFSTFATKGTLSSMAFGQLEGASKDCPEGFGFYNAYAEDLKRGADLVDSADKVILDSGKIVKKLRANLVQLSSSGEITKREIGLAKEARNLSEELIRTNFTEGIDVPTKRWHFPILWGLAGTAFGGAAGFGLDRWAEGRRRRKKEAPEYRSRRRFNWN